LQSGKLRCWGYGLDGELGYGSADKQLLGDDETPAAAGDVPVGGLAVAIAAGGTHTCAILSGGAVRCWGYGLYGALGYANTRTIGDDESAGTGGNVDVGGNVVELALGLNHTCARLDSGAVRCWGYGATGALGYGSTAMIGDNETPATAGSVSLGAAALHVTAGGNHTCAVLTNGVQCWGDAVSGDLGHADTLPIGDNETPASVGLVSIL
jgi:alpha-tubulin suppressor-like RCC1 family protein